MKTEDCVRLKGENRLPSTYMTWHGICDIKKITPHMDNSMCNTATVTSVWVNSRNISRLLLFFKMAHVVTVVTLFQWVFNLIGQLMDRNRWTQTDLLSAIKCTSNSNNTTSNSKLSGSSSTWPLIAYLETISQLFQYKQTDTVFGTKKNNPLSLTLTRFNFSSMARFDN